MVYSRCSSLRSLLSAALGRVGNVRRSGADTIEWDRPSGAPGASDCSISYTVSVAGGPARTVTRSTTTTMISLSAISGDLDTCDSNLRITVIAEVPSIGAVASSISDPAFDPTSGTYLDKEQLAKSCRFWFSVHRIKNSNIQPQDLPYDTCNFSSTHVVFVS